MGSSAQNQLFSIFKDAVVMVQNTENIKAIGMCELATERLEELGEVDKNEKEGIGEPEAKPE